MKLTEHSLPDNLWVFVNPNYTEYFVADAVKTTLDGAVPFHERRFYLTIRDEIHYLLDKYRCIAGDAKDLLFLNPRQVEINEIKFTQIP